MTPESLLQPNAEHIGWISPDGVFYFCSTYAHDRCARVVAEPLGWSSAGALDACEWLIRHGWVRCRGLQRGLHVRWTHHERLALTLPQRRCLAEHGYDPDRDTG